MRRPVLIATVALGLLLWLALAVRAADPSPRAGQIAPASPGGEVSGRVDPRSSGEGPGLELEPLMVAALVVLLGVGAAGGTALYVRLTRDD